MGVSLHSKTPPLFMKCSNSTTAQSYSYQYLSVLPTISMCPFLVNFSCHCIRCALMKSLILCSSSSKMLELSALVTAVYTAVF